MILGVGTDMIEIRRIESSIDQFGERFLRRVFTSEEIDYCQRKKKHAAESFAARFAAKEAGAKALGTGISRGVAWKEIEVRREPSGRPTLHFTGRARELADQLGITGLSVSLTHSRDLALAVVIAEGREVV
jgi:holo-[acyl-carrier protein] synthase